MIDFRYRYKNSQKKTTSVASIHIKPSDRIIAGEMYRVFDIPAKSNVILTWISTIVCEVVPDTHICVGYEGGTLEELLCDKNLGGFTVQMGGPRIRVQLTELGEKVPIQLPGPMLLTEKRETVCMSTDKDLTCYEGLLVVHFIEYDLTNGEYLL